MINEKELKIWIVKHANFYRKALWGDKSKNIINTSHRTQIAAMRALWNAMKYEKEQNFASEPYGFGLYKQEIL